MARGPGLRRWYRKNYDYYHKRWCLGWHYHAQTLQGHLTNIKQSRVNRDAAHALASSPKDVLKSTVFSCRRKAASDWWALEVFTTAVFCCGKSMNISWSRFKHTCILALSWFTVAKDCFSCGTCNIMAIVKTKLALVGLCCKSHGFETVANTNILSTYTTHRSQQSHEYQSTACRRCTS